MFAVRGCALPHLHGPRAMYQGDQQHIRDDLFHSDAHFQLMMARRGLSPCLHPRPDLGLTSTHDSTASTAFALRLCIPIAGEYLLVCGRSALQVDN